MFVGQPKIPEPSFGGVEEVTVTNEEDRIVINVLSLTKRCRGLDDGIFRLFAAALARAGARDYVAKPMEDVEGQTRVKSALNITNRTIAKA